MKIKTTPTHNSSKTLKTLCTNLHSSYGRIFNLFLISSSHWVINIHLTLAANSLCLHITTTDTVRSCGISNSRLILWCTAQCWFISRCLFICLVFRRGLIGRSRSSSGIRLAVCVCGTFLWFICRLHYYYEIIQKWNKNGEIQQISMNWSNLWQIPTFACQEQALIMHTWHIEKKEILSSQAYPDSVKQNHNIHKLWLRLRSTIGMSKRLTNITQT